MFFARFAKFSASSNAAGTGGNKNIITTSFTNFDKSVRAFIHTIYIYYYIYIVNIYLTLLSYKDNQKPCL